MTPTETALPLLNTLTPLLPAIRSSIASLATLVPASQFYRYNDMFTRALQSAAFIVVVDRFLRTEDVASKEAVAAALGSGFVPSHPLSIMRCPWLAR